MALPPLNIEINIRNRSAAALTGFNRILNGTGVGMGRVSAMTRTLTSSLFSLQGVLLTLGGAFTLKKGIENLAEYEVAVIDMARVTEREFAKIREDIMGLDVRLGAPTELTGAYYQAISAGVTDTAKALDLVTTASGAAKAAHVDQATTIKALTALYDGYRRELTGGFSEAADTLFQIERLGKTTFRELVPEIGGVAKVSRDLNISLDEMGAALATITQTSGSTAEAATQYEAMLVALIKPTEALQRIIQQELGFATPEALIAEKGLVGALRAIIAKTNGSTLAMGELFNRVRQSRAISALAANDFALVSERVDEMAKRAGSADAAFERWAETLTGKYDTVMNRLNRTSIKGFEAMGPSFDRVLDWLEEASIYTEEWVEANRNLIASGMDSFLDQLAAGGRFVADHWEEIVLLGKGIIALKIASVVGGWAGSFAILAANLPALVVAINPVTVAVGALVAAGAGLYIISEEMRRIETETARLNRNAARSPFLDVASEVKRLNEEDRKLTEELKKLAGQQSLTGEEMVRAEEIIKRLEARHSGLGIEIDLLTGKISGLEAGLGRVGDELSALETRNLKTGLLEGLREMENVLRDIEQAQEDIAASQTMGQAGPLSGIAQNPIAPAAGVGTWAYMQLRGLPEMTKDAERRLNDAEREIKESGARMRAQIIDLYRLGEEGKEQARNIVSGYFDGRSLELSTLQDQMREVNAQINAQRLNSYLGPEPDLLDRATALRSQIDAFNTETERVRTILGQDFIDGVLTATATFDEASAGLAESTAGMTEAYSSLIDETEEGGASYIEIEREFQRLSLDNWADYRSQLNQILVELGQKTEVAAITEEYDLQIERLELRKRQMQEQIAFGEDEVRLRSELLETERQIGYLQDLRSAGIQAASEAQRREILEAQDALDIAQLRLDATRALDAVSIRYDSSLATGTAQIARRYDWESLILDVKREALERQLQEQNTAAESLEIQTRLVELEEERFTIQQRRLQEEERARAEQFRRVADPLSGLISDLNASPGWGAIGEAFQQFTFGDTWDDQDTIYKAFAKREALIAEHETRLTELYRQWGTDSAQVMAEQAQLQIDLDKLTWDSRISMAKTGFGALSNVAKGFYEIGGRQNEAAFRIYQGFALAEATISAYLAANKALAEGGPVLGPIMAATAIGLGMANVGMIASQSFQAYHEGGKVDVDGRRRPLRDDEYMAVLQRGETVIPNRIQDQAAKREKSPREQAPLIVLVDDRAKVEDVLASNPGRRAIVRILSEEGVLR